MFGQRGAAPHQDVGASPGHGARLGGADHHVVVGVDQGDVLCLQLEALQPLLLLDAALLLLHLVPDLVAEALEAAHQLLLVLPLARLLLHAAETQTHVTGVAVIPENVLSDGSDVMTHPPVPPVALDLAPGARGDAGPELGAAPKLGQGRGQRPEAQLAPAPRAGRVRVGGVGGQLGRVPRPALRPVAAPRPLLPRHRVLAQRAQAAVNPEDDDDHGDDWRSWLLAWTRRDTRTHSCLLSQAVAML